MKKICKFLIFIIITQVLIVCLSGCEFKSNDKKKDGYEVKENGDIVYTKEFGSYTVGNGWEESKSHSTKSKFFYVKNGEDDEKKPNNISIEQGTNKYKKEEHLQFKNAIYKQLAVQVSKDSESLRASGSTTEKGEILYTFITDDGRTITKQYYIVGDNKYICIQETIFNIDDESEVDEIALKMVNSFEWND